MADNTDNTITANTDNTITADNKFQKWPRRFLKCYRPDLVKVLKLIKSPQLRVLTYIIEKTDWRENEFKGTYESIRNAIRKEPGYEKFSTQTVYRVMKELQGDPIIEWPKEETNEQGEIKKRRPKKIRVQFIVKIHNGLWMVNPDVLAKGEESKRKDLLKKFKKLQEANKKKQSPEAAVKDLESKLKEIYSYANESKEELLDSIKQYQVKLGIKDDASESYENVDKEIRSRMDKIKEYIENDYDEEIIDITWDTIADEIANEMNSED